MSTTLPADLSCPRCGAHVRTGSDWCTLCYTDLRPADQREPVPAEPVVVSDVAEPGASAPTVPDATAPGVPAAATPTAVAATPAAPAAPTPSPAPEQQARGKHAKRAAEASPDDAEVLAAQLLAQLAVHESAADPLGRYAGFVDTPGKKAVVIFLGCGVVIGFLLGVMGVIGAVV